MSVPVFSFKNLPVPILDEINQNDIGERCQYSGSSPIVTITTKSKRLLKTEIHSLSIQTHRRCTFHPRSCYLSDVRDSRYKKTIVLTIMMPAPTQVHRSGNSAKNTNPNSPAQSNRVKSSGKATAESASFRPLVIARCPSVPKIPINPSHI